MAAEGGQGAMSPGHTERREAQKRPKLFYAENKEYIVKKINYIGALDGQGAHLVK